MKRINIFQLLFLVGMIDDLPPDYHGTRLRSGGKKANNKKNRKNIG